LIGVDDNDRTFGQDLTDPPVTEVVSWRVRASATVASVGPLLPPYIDRPTRSICKSGTTPDQGLKNRFCPPAEPSMRPDRTSPHATPQPEKQVHSGTE
jgi:hypothetical protein